MKSFYDGFQVLQQRVFQGLTYASLCASPDELAAYVAHLQTLYLPLSQRLFETLTTCAQTFFERMRWDPKSLWQVVEATVTGGERVSMSPQCHPVFGPGPWHPMLDQYEQVVAAVCAHEGVKDTPQMRAGLGLLDYNGSITTTLPSGLSFVNHLFIYDLMASEESAGLWDITGLKTRWLSLPTRARASEEYLETMRSVRQFFIPFLEGRVASFVRSHTDLIVPREAPLQVQLRVSPVNPAFVGTLKKVRFDFHGAMINKCLQINKKSTAHALSNDDRVNALDLLRRVQTEVSGLLTVLTDTYIQNLRFQQLSFKEMNLPASLPPAEGASIADPLEQGSPICQDIKTIAALFIKVHNEFMRQADLFLAS